MISDGQEKEVLLERLALKGAQLKKTRTERFLTQPFKMVYPKMLSSMEKSHQLKASTFWGGKMEVILPDLVSTQIWRNGFFEQDVCTFMLKNLKKNMNFIDIGAHYGFFTLLASYLIGPAGRVLAFEPTPSTFKVLQENTKNYGNIIIFNLAAFDQNCEIDFLDFGFELSAFNSAYGIRQEHGINQEQKQRYMNRAKRIKVEAVKLDVIIVDESVKTDFIKIDAESSEMPILVGMSETIKRDRPIIIVELGDYHVPGGCKSEEIVNWLAVRNYNVYEFINSGIKPHLKKETYQYCNLLFLPR